jgi:hypothetical protein
LASVSDALADDDAGAYLDALAYCDSSIHVDLGADARCADRYALAHAGVAGYADGHTRAHAYTNRRRTCRGRRWPA